MKSFSKISLLTLCFGLFCLFILYTIPAERRKNLSRRIEHERKLNHQEERKNVKEMMTTFELSMERRGKLIDEFNKRKNKIRYFCEDVKTHNGIALNRTIKNLIVDTKYHLTWCPIYKSASSMWMKNFALLTGFPVTKRTYLMQQNQIDYNFVVKQKFQHRISDLDDKNEQIKKTKKFVVVRHPFERLLSAYRDKLEHMQGREYYYKRFGQYITHRYRAKQSILTNLEPSFTEFLQFISQEKQFDEHWVPFVVSCQPCSIDYDYIFKFEYLPEEYNFFIKENNLDISLNYLSNERKNTSAQGITDDSVSKEYFSNVPVTLLQSVYKIYELDFHMFSYSPAKYYQMASDSNDIKYKFV